MEIDHEFNIYGELILKARVGGNLIKRRYQIENSPVLSITGLKIL